MIEQWLPVVGWEGYYEVSDEGRVRSVDRVIIRSDGVRVRYTERLIVPVKRRHLYVKLHRPGEVVRRGVHQLVLEAFAGSCPEGLEARHYPDPDTSNNRLTNLVYGTHSENVSDQVEHGVHPQARKTRCPQGHEYSHRSAHQRKCRTCQTAAQRRYRAQKKAQPR